MMTNIIPIRQDTLFEDICTVCGMDWKELTKSSRGMVNKCCSELRELNPSLHELESRARVYSQIYPDCKLTPTALAKHWPLLKSKEKIPQSHKPYVASWKK